VYGLEDGIEITVVTGATVRWKVMPVQACLKTVSEAQAPILQGLPCS
jgi:hypothetical protein